MTTQDFETAIAALCIWREARGEGTEGMRAVAHVIRNRVQSHGEILRFVTQRFQFSSMTAPGDSQLVIYPFPYGTEFVELLRIVTDVFNDDDEDNTFGATHYFNPKVVTPIWAAGMTKVATIGNHEFYK